MTLAEARKVAMAVDEASFLVGDGKAIFYSMATLLSSRFSTFKWYPTKLEDGRLYLEVEGRR